MRFLSFSFRQAFQGLWRNRVMNLAATVTMILMLVLLATLTIVISGMEAGLTFIESKVEVRAELLDGVPQDRVTALQRELEARPDVAATTYISKEDARAEFMASRAAGGQEDLTAYLSFNPFPAQVAVQLVNPREAEAVAAFLDGETAVVERVNDGQTGIDRLVGITGIPGRSGSWSSRSSG
jgi:cell division protein FtsX